MADRVRVPGTPGGPFPLNFSLGEPIVMTEPFESCYIKGIVAFLFFCSIVASSLISSTTHAFNQADVEKLIATRLCEWCDLHEADLSNSELAGARLTNASLSHVNLAGADLSGANLSSATLPHVNLHGANLSAAFLRNANLRDADLSGANLAKAKLNNADLSNANLDGVDFSGADLSGATWKDGKKCEEGSIKDCKRTGLPRGASKSFPMYPRQGKTY
jgi:uncharacterized protein YjbI with pentapeptide repeats